MSNISQTTGKMADNNGDNLPTEAIILKKAPSPPYVEHYKQLHDKLSTLLTCSKNGTFL